MAWIVNLGAYIMTALLVLLGVLVTILGASTANVKALWIFLFVVIAFGSVGLNFLQKQEEEKAMAVLQNQLKEQGEQLKKLVNFLAAPEELARTGQALRIVESQPKVTTKPDSLKSRLGQLSTSILRFLLDRGETPIPRPQTWEEDTNRMIAHFAETMKLYSLSFGAQVIASRNELSRHGLIDIELDRFYEHPTNTIGIRIVAERLGALAMRLPD